MRRKYIEPDLSMLLLLLALTVSCNSSSTSGATKIDPVADFPEAAPTKQETDSEKIDSEKAWNSFYRKLRVAVKNRDREALKQMMTRDFYFSGGGGDDNRDGDSRDEAFEFWGHSSGRGWDAFHKALEGGAAEPAEWWDGGEKRKYPSRVAPKEANERRNIDSGKIDWYAIFEFRNGQWYCTIFNQCCD
jgi:hypothetical protein